MGLHTFVCRNSGGVWKAKQLTGDLEGRLRRSSIFSGALCGLQLPLTPPAAFSLPSPLSHLRLLFSRSNIMLISDTPFYMFY
ncbi:60S acidic ribosomal protein P3 [Platanthera guangdongensis]|uniref:60S acidic ribosomal protein P3 n=1 Tax=Platanthera guangdongensis TaxID=2320717 RepID=A0ABR2MMU1_9ASPA